MSRTPGGVRPRPRRRVGLVVACVVLVVSALRGVATAGSLPSAPGFRSVTPCPANCVGNVQIFTQTPTLSAWTRDDAHDVLTYQYEVYFSTSTTPASTARVASGTSTPSSNTALDTWTVPAGAITARGVYEYRVRAAARGTTAYGPWSSGWIHFTFEWAAPGAPTLTLSGVGTSSTSPAGTVGHPATLQIGDSDPNVTFVAYSLFSQPASVPYSIGFPLHCGFRDYRDVVYVCRNSDGSWPLQHIAPIATSGTVWAASINAHAEPSVLVAKQYYADADEVGLRAGHSWTFEPTAGTPGYVNPTSPGSGPIPDTAAAGAMPLAHGNGVSLALDAPDPAATGTDPVTHEPVPARVTVSTFDGTGSESTAGPVLDPTRAFTVGAWVRSTSAGRGQYYTIMSQRSSQESSFYLQNSNGNWAMCMPRADLATYHGACSYQYNSPVRPGTWTFVAGAWNPTNQSLTLYTGDGTTLTSIMRSWTVTAPLANGALFVGQDRIGTTQRFFTGAIAEPFAVQASLTTAQLTALMGYRPPSGI